jgi:hypothetical protein
LRGSHFAAMAALAVSDLPRKAEILSKPAL